MANHQIWKQTSYVQAWTWTKNPPRTSIDVPSKLPSVISCVCFSPQNHFLWAHPLGKPDWDGGVPWISPKFPWIVPTETKPQLPTAACFFGAPRWISSKGLTWNFWTFKKPSKVEEQSGQITIIPKPELRAFWGDSLTKPPFGVTSAEVAIICPEKYEQKSTGFHTLKSWCLMLNHTHLAVLDPEKKVWRAYFPY